jgi:hypothetical protein
LMFEHHLYFAATAASVVRKLAARLDLKDQ